MKKFTATELLDKFKESLSQERINRCPASLYEPINYVLSMGGKRMRPVLMLLAYNLYRDDIERVMPQAIALETYHNYTLMHDDLMDNADVRRGKTTVHRKWDDNTAILSGDSMLVLSYQRMARCEEPMLRKIIDLFTETALQIGEGQQYDIEFERRDDVTEDEYIEMIRLKTSVLLACALKMGAIIADAPEGDADNLYLFGEKVGLAFQLQDDYLDVYGDPAVFGKAIGGDIVSNKKTYMLINALNKANDKQREELDRWLSATDFDRKDKIAAVTRLYDEIGIDRLAQEKISCMFEESKRYLEALNVSSESKAELAAYVQHLMVREY